MLEIMSILAPKLKFFKILTIRLVMNCLNRSSSGLGLTFFVILVALGGCSSATVVETPNLPVVPEYVKVPHPAGFDLADLRAIFVSPLAPRAVLGEFADSCDEEFQKLLLITSSKEEIKKGALELVTEDPERMHWCFYSKISRLQDILQSDSTWSVRQKKVLESFQFLSPIANAFLDSFHDSRYLRWATQYYSRVSEWVFFKKLVPTAENTLLLTDGTRELEPWIPVQKEGAKPVSVFAKYGITFAPTVAGAINPLEESSSAVVKSPPASTERTRAPASIEK